METVEQEQIKSVRETIAQHSMEDKENFKEIREILTVIKENHLYHIEKDIAVIKNSNMWMGRFIWLVISVFVSGIISYVFTML